SPTLSTMQGGNRQPKIAIPGNTVKTVGNVNPSGNGMNEDVFSGAGLSPTLTTNKGEGPKVCLPTLTPDRIEKRQNGRRFKEDGEPMFTLTSQDKHGVLIREATKKGYTVAEPGDSVNISFPDSETRRGRVGKQTANTLLTGEEQGVVLGVVVRKVHSLEDLEERFMNESDYLKKGEIKQIIFDEFGVDRKCNRCNNQVLISDIEGYPYLCFECDENLFEVETYKDIEMVVGSTQKNAATTDGTLSPTLTSAMGQGGGHV